MTYRPRSSVTTILANFVGRSVVSAITHTPASGPLGPLTTPPRSPAPTRIAGSVVCCASSRVRPTTISAATATRVTAATSSTRVVLMCLLLLARYPSSGPDEPDVGAAGIRRAHEHRLLAGVADPARRRRHPVARHETRRRVHGARTMQHLEGPGSAARERLGGGTVLRGLRHRQPGRPEVEHRHVRLDDVAALDLGHRDPEYPAVRLGRRGHVGDGDVHALG